jgi:hypothetical protein
MCCRLPPFCGAEQGLIDDDAKDMNGGTVAAV